MFKAMRHKVSVGLFRVIRYFEEKERSCRLKRDRVSALIFFHGFDGASVHRALEVGKELRRRGYQVEFAGTGSVAEPVRQTDFPLHDLATPIQDLGVVLDFDLDEADCDSFVHQSVEAERVLIDRLKPDLAIVDSRPTLRLAAALEGVDVVWIRSAYTIAIRNDLKGLGFLFMWSFRFLSSLFQERFQMVSDRSLSDFIASNPDALNSNAQSRFR